MKNKKLQAGYTLIELLAVMIILMAVGTIITSILVITLRSGNKSTTTNDIRQNGNYAMAQMSKMITYAQEFEGVSVNDPSQFPAQLQTDCTSQPAFTQYKYLRIKSFDEGITTFACTDSKIASQSSIVSTPQAGWTFCANEGAQCSFTGTANVQYGANGSYFYKILTNGTPCTNAVFGDPLVGTVKQCYYQATTGTLNYLVDPNMVTTCYFNCTQESAAAPVKIDIFLDLKTKNQTIFSESQAEIPFETSVIIRNSGSR
jgi:type II secretory pathway pseudopilin PulG